MSIMLQIATLFVICLLGEGITTFFGLAIPGSIIGMTLLLAFLLLRWIKIQQVEQVGNFLLKNLAFFFVPAGVSVMEHYEMLKGNIIILIVICLITTILTFGATGITVKIVMRLQEKMRRGEHV